jgi:hypothetical protein
MSRPGGGSGFKPVMFQVTRFGSRHLRAQTSQCLCRKLFNLYIDQQGSRSVNLFIAARLTSPRPVSTARSVAACAGKVSHKIFAAMSRLSIEIGISIEISGRVFLFRRT